MADITTGRVEGDHITLDERLSDLDDRRVRVTVEPLEEPAEFAGDEASGDRPAGGELPLRWMGEAEMRWLAEHAREYAGKWVALEGDHLVACGSSAREVYAEARRLGVGVPFVDLVEPEEQGAFWGGWL